LASQLLVQKHDLRILANIVGRILLLMGVVGLIPLVTCAIFGELFAVPGFVTGSLLAFGLGLLLFYPFREASDARNKHGMMAAAVGWLLVALVGAVPFAMVSTAIPEDSELFMNMTFLDGYFEAMSGWTGTGLTMVDDESLLPRSIQFWRTLTQWVGGVGVIVLMLAVLARPGTGAFSLYMGEARSDRLEPRIIDTVRQIWKIFLIYTVVGILLLIVVGMPVWDSINHAMTGLATGGFSVQDDSIGTYDRPIFEMAIIPLMLLGAISFVVHNDVLRKRFGELIQDIQNKVLFALCALGTFLLTAELFINGPFLNDLWSSFRFSFFQFVSAITCTGLQSTDLGGWTPSAKVVISMAMIAGGAAGSTVGGIKLVRLILVTKGAHWKFMQTFMPSGIYIKKKLGRAILSEDEMTEDILEAATLSFMYLIMLVIGILVIMHIVGPGQSLDNVLFEVCSAQGNVGMSVGITGPAMDPAAKIMLILNMWAGRLEIFPVLMLLQSIFFYTRLRRRATRSVRSRE